MKFIKRGDKKGQFYLIATIIIVGLMIGLAVIFNYSSNINSSQAKEIAKELQIESERVLDYDMIHSTTEFDNFGKDYSAYAGEDKEIYFIVVNGSYQKAYKYTKGAKIDYSSNLDIHSGNIQFNLGGEIYNFKLNEGKNVYFLVLQDIGGERYVFTG